MNIPVYQVDAFTHRPFRGNPAAVCILPEPGDETWMQNIAGEMNLSETAFLVRVEDGYNLRWFTPAVEVELCGHATLASAHTLWETGLLDKGSTARFHSLSGLLTAKRRGDWIEMDFPARPEQEASAPAGLLNAIGETPFYVGKNKYDFIAAFDSEEQVRRLQPDITALKALSVRGIMVTSTSSTGEFDFVSRFFAPGSGIDEDPVTGSAHCCLGPFWKERLGKNEMRAYQASRRGGVVNVRVAGERVILGGQAVRVMQGELMV